MRTMVELVHNSCNIDDKVNPIRTGGGAGIHPPPTGFCPLLKKSAYDPYLKFLDFSQLLVVDTPMNFFSLEKFRLHPVQNYLFFIFCFHKKNLFTNPS